MGYIRYRQAKKANRLAKQTRDHAAATARAATAQARTAAAAAAAEEAEMVTPEEAVRRHAAIRNARSIDAKLKAGGYRDRNERHYIQGIVVNLVGGGETIDDAIESVLRWRADAEGASRSA